MIHFYETKSVDTTISASPAFTGDLSGYTSPTAWTTRFPSPSSHVSCSCCYTPLKASEIDGLDRFEQDGTIDILEAMLTSFKWSLVPGGLLNTIFINVGI